MISRATILVFKQHALPDDEVPEVLPPVTILYLLDTCSQHL
jgi:hypothetical protein